MLRLEMGFQLGSGRAATQIVFLRFVVEGVGDEWNSPIVGQDCQAGLKCQD